MSDDDTDSDGPGESGDNRLETTLPGIEVTTSLADADPEELEAVHRRQLEYALDNAEEAKEATRM